MTKLRILIVDDEPLARNRVRAMLKSETDAEVVGECGNGPDAIEAIRQEKPDVVFLDMQMPGCDGLHVVGDLPADNRPAIIFVTAHENFAVDAFAVHATDYLLKPFDQQRFKTALDRAAQYVRARRTGDLGARLESILADSAPAQKKPGRLAFKSDGRVVFLKPEEIIWIEAADNYVLLHLVAAPRLMLRETLSALETRLGAVEFTRVSRSAIVRLDQVKELQPTFHGDYTVVLRDGTRVPLSRSHRGQLEKFTSEGV
ncbi:MAG: LytTR family DNA-binding domain-containing protein [Opitutus sp.]